MTSSDHPLVTALRQGPSGWEHWFRDNRAPLMRFPGLVLEDLDLEWWKITHLDLSGATFRRVNVNSALLGSSTFDNATFENVDLGGSALMYSSFRSATFRECDLQEAVLTRADFSDAKIENCLLMQAHFVETNLHGALVRNCPVYGCSVWNVETAEATFEKLRITPPDLPGVYIDDLEMAQFIYLLLDNRKLRRAIDSITSKVVLLLGRFTPENKRSLDTIRLQLRHLNYVPVMFDFEKPEHRDTLETVTLLARMARFVIADITDPRSIPQELMSIVAQLPSVPVVPLLRAGNSPWGMWDAVARYPWVQAVQTYASQSDLLSKLDSILATAERAVARVYTIQGNRNETSPNPGPRFVKAQTLRRGCFF